ncbi:probable F-box protein At1g60180 [Euphorbia lathyris]|uniref:probable F-box protein At1g60180 n=1 Tax=Euphorbia lathyris TaxID=212925 RepID=UPI0033135BE8
MDQNNSEEESVGASSVDDTEQESGGSSSEDDTERAGNKRLKLQGEEDRISAFPDSLIQHILIFDSTDSKSPWERCLAMKIFGQLQHMKLLEIGSWVIKILSALEMEGLSSPLLNCKCSTVDGTNFDEDLPGIICAIRSSPMLEKLVIKLQHIKSRSTGTLRDLNDRRSKKNYWDSNGTVFNCSMSNLKTLKIIGLSWKDDKHKLVFKFVEFLLKNGRMLDKVVIILPDCGTGIPFEVSKKMLSFQRCFPHTTIELLSSN